MIDVEVRGRLGQFIKAILRNVVESDAIVSYSSGNSEERVPISSVRLPPLSSREVQAGQDAEVLFAVVDLQLGNPACELTVVAPGGWNSDASARVDDQLSLPAWWPCRVHKVRDEVAVVKLQVSPPPNSTADETERCAQLSNITDIVNRNTLRHASSGTPALSASLIHRHSIEIPKELADFAADLSVHTDFLKHCGEPASPYFDAPTSTLIILSTDEGAIRNVALLEETHLKMLRQKWAITRSLRQTMRSLEANRGHDGHMSLTNSRSGGDWDVVEPGMFVEKFFVPQRLMGLAIGAQGNNIRSAREIPGVVSIRLRDSGDFPKRGGEHMVDDIGDCGDSAFIVEARTAEAAKQARAKLEFTDLYLGVPRRYVGRLIGRRTNNILSIIRKSGVVQIHFDDHIKGPSDEESVLNIESLNLNHCSGPRTPSPNMRRVFLRTGGTQATAQPHADEEYGGFILSGTRDAVERARLLISFQLDYIYDLEKMEAEKTALIRNLSHSGPDSGNGYPRSHLDGPGRWGDRPMGAVGGRGGRGVRRVQRGAPYPGMGSSETDPMHSHYADNGATMPYGSVRRPPRDSRNVRGYNGDARSRRQIGGRGAGGSRRGGIHEYSEWNDRTGSNGDVVDRRRGSLDSDTVESNPSHEAGSTEVPARQRRSRVNRSGTKRDFERGRGGTGLGFSHDVDSSLVDSGRLSDDTPRIRAPISRSDYTADAAADLSRDGGHLPRGREWTTNGSEPLSRGTRVQQSSNTGKRPDSVEATHSS